MTDRERDRNAARGLAILRHAREVTGNVSRTCRYYGIIAPDGDSARHLAWLRERLGERFVYGVVFHTGPALYKLDDRIVAVPICACGDSLPASGRRMERLHANEEHLAVRIGHRLLHGDLAFPGRCGPPPPWPGMVYVGSHDSRIYALGAATGDLLWSPYTRGWAGDPAVSDGVLYVGSYDTTLYAFALPA